MRTIKFRAWVEDFDPILEKESVMFYSTKDNTTYMIGDRELKCCGNEKPKGVLESFLENKRTPVMQFTGLLDKNGKEIYEGDICKFYIKGHRGEYVSYIKYFEEYGMYGFSTVPHYYETTTNNNRPMGSSGSSTSWKPYLPNSYRKIEIVGNIYENPNLLTNN